MSYKGTLIVVAGLLLAGCQSTGQDQHTGHANSAVGSDLRPGDRGYEDMIRDTKPPAGSMHEVREGVFTPIEAVVYAARVAPDSVAGTFGMEVRNFGYSGGHLYLNSEQNYREQTSVSIRVHPEVEAYLQGVHGDQWLQDLMGKNIEVEGAAQREVIWFFDSARGRTDSYYYQTHVQVTDPNQITIL